MAKAPAQTEPSFPRSFGDYELLEEIARGGMGVVYRARQVSLGRIVAVKMLLFGPLAGPQLVQRFRTEAAAAASLQHPNIVAIHEVGFRDGQHFFAMDCVAGRSLAEMVREGPLPARRAVGYVKTIAEAIHYAHERGILHRDLKPSNVLIDATTDQPRVTDFGLAKRLPHSELETQTSELTLTGQVLGSPNYMPPEQAAANRGLVGKRSDVYSLGAILYHLLTGRPPFQAETLSEILSQVLNRDPVSPRLLNSSVPRDLDTICLNCLEKEPAKRYPTAQALVEELNLFLSGEPILARPVGRAERAWRWCRRKPMVASLGAGVALLALVVVLGSPLAAWRIGRERERAERSAQAENHQRRLRLLGQSAAVLPSDPPLALSLAIEAAKRTPGLQANNALLAALDAVHLQRLLPHDHEVESAAVSTDGRRILARMTAAPNNVLLWDAVTGERISVLETDDRNNSAVFSPDGQRVLTGRPAARLWNAATGRELLRLKGPASSRSGGAFSPDGTRVLTVLRGDLVACDADSGAELVTFRAPQVGLQAGSFNPDGRRVAAISSNQTVRMFESQTGQELLVLDWRNDQAGAVTEQGTSPTRDQGEVTPAPPLSKPVPIVRPALEVRSIVFSPDGTKLLTTSSDHRTRIWDAASGQLLANVRAIRLEGLFSFSPDGKRFLDFEVGRSPQIHVVDATTGKTLLGLKGHTDTISDAQFSPDGQRIVSGADDRTVRVWDAVTATELTVLRGHEGQINSVAFSADGTRVVSAAQDRTVGIWSVESGRDLATLHTRPASGPPIFRPDGKAVFVPALVNPNLYDLEARRSFALLIGYAGELTAASFSPDGRRVIARAVSGKVWVWPAVDRASAVALADVPQGNWSAPIGLGQVSFSPDGHQVVAASADSRVRIWNAVSGAVSATLAGHTDEVISAAFSPDGQRVLTASLDTTARVWEAATGNQQLILRGHHGPLGSAQFSRDGQWVLTYSAEHVWARRVNAAVLARPEKGRTSVSTSDFTACLWDAASGRHLATLPHARRVTFACFSPDGHRVLTAAGAVSVWDAASRVRLISLQEEGDWGEFSPDGTRLLTRDLMGHCGVWDAATGEKLLTLAPESGVSFAAFSPNGESVLTLSKKKVLRLWPVHPLAIALQRQARALTLAELQTYDLADENPVLWISKGVTLEQNQQSEAAYQAFSKAIELTSARSDWNEALTAALLNRSKVLLGQRRLSEAAADRLRALNLPPRAPRAGPHLIDLSLHYNASLTAPWHAGSSRNDLAALPRGVQTLAGVQFDVRGLVQAGAKSRTGQAYPKRISGIAVGRPCRRLHFLHSAIHAASTKDGVTVGRYVVHFGADQRREVSLAIGRDLADWWAGRSETNKLFIVAWTGTNEASRQLRASIRLFKTTWENPSPAVPVSHIDFESTHESAAPFLVAITTE